MKKLFILFFFLLGCSVSDSKENETEYTYLIELLNNQGSVIRTWKTEIKPFYLDHDIRFKEDITGNTIFIKQNVIITWIKK